MSATRNISPAAPFSAVADRTAGTGGTILVERCQICGSRELERVVFLGFLPPVNTMAPVGSRPAEQPAYPAEVLQCGSCELVQLGLIVDPAILFPPDYAYTSGTTRILRENFAQLYEEVMALYPLQPESLVVDIGSNDGTLLSGFFRGGHRVCGVEPTNAARLAIERGITTVQRFFDAAAAEEVVNTHGRADLVTAANVFAHIEDIHSVVSAILDVLTEDGVFISESHYLLSLLETVQYDTIYHEHLRYYSLKSLSHLLEAHGLEVIHARRIPTHGGSIRAYAARRGRHEVRPSVAEMLRIEGDEITSDALRRFRDRTGAAKLGLLALIADLRARGAQIYGVGAPSRASTMVNYVGLDDSMIECVVEIAGSHKIDKYMPGTLIPVRDERLLFAEQPEYALLFSWHIADELVPKLRQNGYRGGFIVPLPQPHVVT